MFSFDLPEELMYYLVCFICSLLILLWIIASGENLKTSAILLILVTVIGDGGYLAMAYSESLEKALLANTLIYTIGIFTPMLFFFNICDICRIKLPVPATVLMYLLQILLYLCVCSTGRLGIFYKTAEFHIGPAGGYLTKTYGPAHTLYLITMAAYFSAAVILSFHFSRKKNIVSFQNVDILIFISFLLIGSYAVERLIHLNIELMPFIYTLGIFGILLPIVKLSKYSIDNNSEIIEASMQTTGYIIFTNKLLYMGCNRYAGDLFPELLEWELERKIPGNGGRFNIFLRPAFMKYVSSGESAPQKARPFSIKGQSYNCELSRLHRNKKVIGYVIKILNVSDYAKES
ncbi:MAG: hypothetical protein IJ073_05040 [Lachnospiraceae bacterium]|nr:hypothetical protein [Lachnospiraceae bacterium]